MNRIPEKYMLSMVKLGRCVDKKLDTYYWFGTGFLIAYERLPGTVFLVTNKHVIADEEKLSMLFKIKGSSERKVHEAILWDGSKELWIGHDDPEIDLGIIPLDRKNLDLNGFDYHAIHTDEILIHEEMEKYQIGEGAKLYSLCFPVGINSDEEYPYARTGMISQIQAYYNNDSSYFIIDMYVFPGNSGGPVFVVLQDDGNPPVKVTKLIGVARAFLTYVEEAVSIQTNKTRITFEDNAGLASVELAYNLLKILKEYKKDTK
jgi:hypothetical protein